MFDIPGMLALVVLIVVFAFPTTRAWRLNNRLLKWPACSSPAADLIPALIGMLALNGYAN